MRRATLPNTFPNPSKVKQRLPEEPIYDYLIVNEKPGDTNQLNANNPRHADQLRQQPAASMGLGARGGGGGRGRGRGRRRRRGRRCGRGRANFRGGRRGGVGGQEDGDNVTTGNNNEQSTNGDNLPLPQRKENQS